MREYSFMSNPVLDLSKADALCDGSDDDKFEVAQEDESCALDWGLEVFPVAILLRAWRRRRRAMRKVRRATVADRR